MLSVRGLKMLFKSLLKITIQNLISKNLELIQRINFSTLELIIVTRAIDAMLFIAVKERKGCFAYYR